MKTRIVSVMAMLFAFMSCDESLEVNGPKIPAESKTVTVKLSNIPAGYAGATMYVFSLNNKGEVYAMEQAKATDGAEIKIAPVPGIPSFDIAAIIPTGSDWTSKNPFVEGQYSRVTSISDRDAVFVTKTWSNASTLDEAPASGIKASLEATLFVNNSSNPADVDFTKGEIVTLDAAVTDNISAGLTSVAFILDKTQLESYTTTPYKFQWNTVNATKGSHWIYVKALNTAGHTALDSINVFISDVGGNVGPSVAFSNLSNNQEIIRQTVVNIGAAVSDPDDGLDKVEFRVNDVLIGTDKTAPFSALWDTYSNQVGSVTVKITAFDKAGQSRSDVVNVKLTAPTNYAPRVTLTTPANNATFPVGTATVTLNATTTDPEGDAVNRVEFSYRNAQALSDTFLGSDATSPYSFDFNTAALPAGTYYIFAKAFDNNGNSSYTSVTITIQ